MRDDVSCPVGRNGFELPGDVVWLDTAHQGPLPSRAIEALERALASKLDPSDQPDDAFFDVPERLRAVLAEFLGASPEEVVIGNSTSHGLHLLAGGLDLAKGDEVVLVEDDFPATVLPWLPLRDRGVEIQMLRRRAGLSLETISEAISTRTRVLCVTWVDSFTGHVLEVESLGELCRSRDVLLILNATQGLGVRPPPVGAPGVQAVCSAGYKWLCGPYGTGVCWIAADLLPRLSTGRRYWLPGAREGGLDDLTGLADASLPVGVRRHDVFCPASFFNVLPWIAALEYLSQIGIERLAAHNRSLVSALRRAVMEAGHHVVTEEGTRSPFLVFTPGTGQDAEALETRLRSAGVHVSLRHGRLRASPHVHNDLEDIARFRDALGAH